MMRNDVKHAALAEQIVKPSFEMLHEKLVESLPEMEGRFAAGRCRV
jgi:hypothetical protein